MMQVSWWALTNQCASFQGREPNYSRLKFLHEFGFCWSLCVSSIIVHCCEITTCFSVTKKNCQMSVKVAQKWFHLKNEIFWHLYKNCLRIWEIWTNELLHKGLEKSNKSPNLVTLEATHNNWENGGRRNEWMTVKESISSFTSNSWSASTSN